MSDAPTDRRACIPRAHRGSRRFTGANLAAVLLLGALVQHAARLLRMQDWALLGPMLLLSTLHAAGWLTIELPRWLLAAAYWATGGGLRSVNWR